MDIIQYKINNALHCGELVMIDHGKHLPETLGWEEENLGGGKVRWRTQVEEENLGGGGEELRCRRRTWVEEKLG